MQYSLMNTILPLPCLYEINEVIRRILYSDDVNRKNLLNQNMASEFSPDWNLNQFSNYCSLCLPTVKGL